MMKSKKTNNKVKDFWKSFRAFITRGNVIDLAVGVVIGASFGKIVTGLVNYIINPFIGLFIKSGDLDSIKTVITPAILDASGTILKAEVAIMWGSWVRTILDFLITAFFIFVFLRIFMRAKEALEFKKIAEEKAKADEEKTKAEAENKAAELAAEELRIKRENFEASIVAQERLLTEIRDIIAKNKQ